MRKVLLTVVSMLLGGVVTFYVTMFILMELGLRYHDNFEYYAQYPIYAFVPATVGFLVPGVVVWFLHRRKKT